MIAHLSLLSLALVFKSANAVALSFWFLATLHPPGRMTKMGIHYKWKSAIHIVPRGPVDVPATLIVIVIAER